MRIETKLCKNKEWLEKKYWEEEYSVRAIAAMRGVGHNRIRRLMRESGILLRNRIEARNTKRCIEMSRKNMSGKNNHQYGKYGPLNPNWKNGRRVNQGYVYIRKPDHPKVNCDGYVAEHILIWMNHWKRDIPKGHMIHHIDWNKQNNKIENLMLVNHSVHTNIHKKPVSKETREKMSKVHKEIWRQRKVQVELFGG